MHGLQFQSRSHVQRVERPNAQSRRVPLSQLYGNFECAIGYGRFPPKILGAMLLKSL